MNDRERAELWMGENWRDWPTDYRDPFVADLEKQFAGVRRDALRVIVAYLRELSRAQDVIGGGDLTPRPRWGARDRYAARLLAAVADELAKRAGRIQRGAHGS